MTNTHNPGYALVCGAGGGLGRATLVRLLENRSIQRVFALSSQEQPPSLLAHGRRISWLRTDYSENSLQQLVESMADQSGKFRRVAICNGLLHNTSLQPEKRIEDLEAKSLLEVMQANALAPILLLKHFLPLLKGKEQCVAAAFSARVGSIGDNGLGGWYSYRASKAALNMLLKTASVEYARRAPNVKLIAFHPGTTDTQLSKPFQAAVANEKLFTPEFVADRLASIMDQQTLDGELSYLDWDNKPIAW